MPLVPIPADVWTEVVTTAEETIIQNPDSHFAIYVTTEDTTGDNFDEGILLPALAAINFPSGVTVSAASVHRPGFIAYTGG